MTETATHVHRWLDITDLGDKPNERSFLCSGCGSRKTDVFQENALDRLMHKLWTSLVEADSNHSEYEYGEIREALEEAYQLGGDATFDIT